MKKKRTKKLGTCRKAKMCLGFLASCGKEDNIRCPIFAMLFPPVKTCIGCKYLNATFSPCSGCSRSATDHYAPEKKP